MVIEINTQEFNELFRKAREEVLEITKENPNTIVETKSLNDLIKKITSLFVVDAVKDTVIKTIRTEFIMGALFGEEQINKLKPFNYSTDDYVIEFLSNYTFDNVKDMTDDIAKGLRTQLQIAFMNGEGKKKIKERVKQVFDVGDNRAMTIARTEIRRARQMGTYSAWKESGIPVKKWIRMKDDERTSEISRAINKKYGTPKQAIPLEENFKATVKVGKKTIVIDQLTPPFHPNERCETIYEVIEE